MAKKKYRPSYIIWDLGSLVFLLNQGDWIYLWDRPKHPRFIENMSLLTLRNLIGKKALRKAILT